MKLYQSKIEALLNTADIQVNGNRPWDIQVHNPAFFNRILGRGSLGAGEAYTDVWWDCEQLDELFRRIISSGIRQRIVTVRDYLFFLTGHLLNRQSGKRSLAVAKQHYDVGNNLYQKMLDHRMICSCGYWQDATDLDQAQEHKLELVCRKLKLKAGMRVLDVGCGWGGAAYYMADKYNVDVVGVSISQAQLDLAEQNNNHPRVEFRLQDYRQLNEPFDRIYSIGMFEHVGFKNYRQYFHTMNRCLKTGGMFLLHTIGHRRIETRVDPWINRCIFPNSILPSAELIARDSCDFFSIEDWHNFGLDYYKTLMVWHHNIEQAWSELPEYDDRFRRMWRYYLMASAGSFMAYHNHLWQIVLSKGVQGQPYRAVRSAVS